MEDVRPLPLAEDDDDFFSDLGSDDPYIRQQDVGSGSRLVIDLETKDNTPRSPRTNPFSTTEIRARNVNHNQNPQHDEHGAAGNGSTEQTNGHGRRGSQSTNNDAVLDHCHIPHNHEEDNTVRNQLIAISIFTTAFGAGETVGKLLS